MPEPKNKSRIIEQLHAERRRLEQNLSRLAPADMLLPGVVGEWSVKDVLSHLADWEEHFPGWLAASQRGDKDIPPDPGLTWSQLDILNQRIYEKHRDRSLEDVLTYFNSVHQHFMSLVETLTDDEILTPGYYSLTGKAPLYSWLAAYASHDRWAKTHIRKWFKSR